MREETFVESLVETEIFFGFLCPDSSPKKIFGYNRSGFMPQARLAYNILRFLPI
jgi:hypothetical protein